MKEEKIRCLLVNPYELPKEIEIENTLEAKQTIVDGFIDCICYNDVILIFNDEGKINGMRPNRDIGTDIIFGPFLIVGDDFENGEFKSLTDKQILDNKIRFDKNSIIRTENKILNMFLSKNIKEDFER